MAKKTAQQEEVNETSVMVSPIADMVRDTKTEELTSRYMKPEQGQMYLFVPTGFEEITFDEDKGPTKVVKGLCSEDGQNDFSAVWGETVVVGEIEKAIASGKVVLGITVLAITFTGMAGVRPNEYKNFKIHKYGELKNSIS